MRLAPPRHRALVVVGTFLSSVLDLIGLTMMVPLIIAATDLRNPTKGIVVALGTVLAVVGLPFAPHADPGDHHRRPGAQGAWSACWSRRYVGTVVAKVTRDMRIRLIRSLLGARWGYFVRQPVGRLAFAIGPEADAAGQCFEALTRLLASMLQVLVFVTILALLSWQLLVIAIVATVVTSLWFGGLVRQARQVAKEHRHEVRQRVGQVHRCADRHQADPRHGACRAVRRRVRGRGARPRRAARARASSAPSTRPTCRSR